LDVFGVIVEFMTPRDDAEISVMRATMPPGVTVPLHSHNDFEDFYILAGTYQVLVKGDGGMEWRDFRAGDYVRVPGDVPHALRNVSQEPVVDLIITTARMGNFFHRRTSKSARGHRLSTPARRWRLTPQGGRGKAPP
jgi:quercetin dioxygenase-like cupin family protein